MTHLRFMRETHPSQTESDEWHKIYKQLFYMAFKVLAFTLLYSP